MSEYTDYIAHETDAECRAARCEGCDHHFSAHLLTNGLCEDCGAGSASGRVFHIARRDYGRHPTALQPSALQDSYLLIQAGPNWTRGLAPGYMDTGDTLATNATADAQLYIELRAHLESAL